MKKFLLTCLTVCVWTLSPAQVSLYSFTQSSITYAAITGGTLLGTTSNDNNNFNAQSIGFTFKYNGINYTQISVNADGFIAMGTTVISSYTSISTGASNNVIAAFNLNLMANATSELRIQTIGSAPNRTCVVQWKDYRKYVATGIDNFNFQIRLNETTNTIDIVYGTIINSATTATVQVGLRGASNTSFNNRTTTSNWAATMVGAANNSTCSLSSTIYPASGQKFTWTPPPPCTGAPAAGTTASTANPVNSGVNFTLSLTGASSPAWDITYQWQSSPDGSIYSNITGATSATFVTNQTADTYYRCLLTCTSSTLSASSTPLQVTIVTSIPTTTQCTLDFYDGFESGSYTPAWSMGPGFSSGSATTTSAAVGTYSIMGIGGNSHLNGFSTSFTPATPTNMSWYIYPSGTGFSNYFVAGNAAVTATNCIAFAYWVGSVSAIRFVSSFNYDYPATPNQWHHIELKNINWVNHTFDIYINNTLQSTAFPFRSTTQNDVSSVHLYNYSNESALWDDIKIGAAPVTSSVSSQNNVSCNGLNNGAATLTASGGNGTFAYAWTPTGDTTATATGLAPGTHTCTITDGNGCSSIDTVNIIEPGPIASFISSSDVLCNGGNNGSATITLSGGATPYSYYWSPSGGTSSTATNLSAGIYTVTVTDDNNCVLTQVVSITEPPPLNIITSTVPENCNGCNNGTATASVSGGTPPYSYSWNSSPVQNAATATNLAAGIYTVTITDGNNCTTSATETVPLSTRINEEQSNFYALLYPNPGEGNFHLRLRLPLNSSVNLAIYDMLGKKIFHLNKAQLPAGSYNYDVDLTTLSEGSYFYQLTIGERTVSKKLSIIN